MEIALIEKKINNISLRSNKIQKNRNKYMEIK